MRARQISKNLDFKRGIGAQKSLNLGIFKDAPELKGLRLPVRHIQGSIVDSENVIIMRAAGTHKSTLLPWERRDLLEYLAKLINLSYGVQPAD